ncbi:TPA: two-component-system connector protein YcgZ [Kluyvera cryocrescens]|nr:two-component-system connector protein YcgZ [Kluyvera cryocrescens]HEP1899060.1 two-component-system connector protein YcgZ [Kluyvera cryocrescens]
MQKNVPKTDSAGAISRYFARAQLPTQQHTLGEIVTEILTDGRHLNRKAICTKLLSRLEKAETPEQETYLNQLIGMLFE